MEALERVLAYKNNAVIERFCSTFEVERAEAENLFQETKKWIFINDQANNDSKAPLLFIDDSTKIIDEMWHNFILFTADYKTFCVEYLTSFLHHHPSTEENNLLGASYRTLLTDMYSYLYDHLGEDTLIKWYKTYPEKYSSARLNELRVGQTPSTKVREINDTLTLKIVRELDSDGFSIVNQSVSLEQFRTLASCFGQIINETEIKIDPNTSAAFSTSNAMTFHTDSPKARIVAWHAIEESKKEPTILLDSKEVLAVLSKEEVSSLLRSKIQIPATSGRHPVLSLLGPKLQFYYADWLVDEPSIANILTPAIKSVQQSKARHIGLLKGTSLFVDNTRMLHARDALSPESRRHLFRVWLG